MKNYENDMPDDMKRDLRRIYRREIDVPARTDDAVMSAAARVMAQRRRRLWVRRWAPVAAAAVVALAVVTAIIPGSRMSSKLAPVATQSDYTSPGKQMQGDTTAKSSAQETVVASAPVGEAKSPVGKPTILDAFALARGLDAGQQMDARWDVNGDGVVDKRDVDALAMAAVKLN
jgi:hypothetical protein